MLERYDEINPSRNEVFYLQLLPLSIILGASSLPGNQRPSLPVSHPKKETDILTNAKNF